MNNQFTDCRKGGWGHLEFKKIFISIILVGATAFLFHLISVYFNSDFEQSREQFSYLKSKYIPIIGIENPFPEPYQLFLYKEEPYTGEVESINIKGPDIDKIKTLLSGIPVIFIHGHAGYYRQCRGFSSFSEKIRNSSEVKFDYFTIDFAQELCAFSGAILERQIRFLKRTIIAVRELYKEIGNLQPIILLGHSMGGVVAKGATYMLSSDEQRHIRLIITLNTPHLRPIGAPDQHFLEIFQLIQDSFLKSTQHPSTTSLISFSTGLKDHIIPHELSALPDSKNTLHIMTPSMPYLWASMEHQASLSHFTFIQAVHVGLINSLKNPNIDVLTVLASYWRMPAQNIHPSLSILSITDGYATERIQFTASTIRFTESGPFFSFKYKEILLDQDCYRVELQEALDTSADTDFVGILLVRALAVSPPSAVMISSYFKKRPGIFIYGNFLYGGKTARFATKAKINSISPGPLFQYYHSRRTINIPSYIHEYEEMMLPVLIVYPNKKTVGHFHMDPSLFFSQYATEIEKNNFDLFLKKDDYLLLKVKRNEDMPNIIPVLKYSFVDHILNFFFNSGSFHVTSIPSHSPILKITGITPHMQAIKFSLTLKPKQAITFPEPVLIGLKSLSSSPSIEKYWNVNCTQINGNTPLFLATQIVYLQSSINAIYPRSLLSSIQDEHNNDTHVFTFKVDPNYQIEGNQISIQIEKIVNLSQWIKWYLPWLLFFYPVLFFIFLISFFLIWEHEPTLLNMASFFTVLAVMLFLFRSRQSIFVPFAVEVLFLLLSLSFAYLFIKSVSMVFYFASDFFAMLRSLVPTISYNNPYREQILRNFLFFGFFFFPFTINVFIACSYRFCKYSLCHHSHLYSSSIIQSLAFFGMASSFYAVLIFCQEYWIISFNPFTFFPNESLLMLLAESTWAKNRIAVIRNTKVLGWALLGFVVIPLGIYLGAINPILESSNLYYPLLAIYSALYTFELASSHLYK